MIFKLDFFLSIDSYYLEEMKKSAPASVEILNRSYDEATRELSFDVSSAFIVSDSGFTLEYVWLKIM